MARKSEYDGKRSGETPKVLWSELLPHEFKTRLAACPVVYLPMGLCEPHGQISAYGLDTIKAEYLCAEAARRCGGIVAPSLGYHIHEAGYHAPWLKEEVGEQNPHMTAMPPHAVLYFFLYQLRAFVNAGFKGIIVVTGHSGGNQEDLRLAAELFRRRAPLPMWVGSDPELVKGLYSGDHAGKYEISQLMYLRPDLIDVTRRELEESPGSGGRLALGADAGEASPELGERIIEASLAGLGGIAAALLNPSGGVSVPAACDKAGGPDNRSVSACDDNNVPDYAKNESSDPGRSEAGTMDLQGSAMPGGESAASGGMIGYETVEAVWRELFAAKAQWRTAYPYDRQRPVPADSRWKPYEDVR